MNGGRQRTCASRRWLLAAGVGLLRASPLRAQTAARTLRVGEGDNGHRLPARIGDTIEIRLTENASTGYSWEVDRVDEKVLRLLEKTTHPPDKPMPGAPGEAIFRFAVIGAGLGPLALKLLRPWEGDPSIVQRFAVTIDAASS